MGHWRSVHGLEMKSYNDDKSVASVNSFTNLYALYSPEYVPSLCQVGARSINTNLLDLASNLVFTNTGQSLGTCARRSQNSGTFENCYFIGSGPGIGPHNSST